MAPQPPLFQPFRALGYITDDLPFAVQRRGREAYVTVSVGKCWQARAQLCARIDLIAVLIERIANGLNALQT